MSAPTPGSGEPAGHAIRCAVCGNTAADGAAFTWSSSVDRSGRRAWTCPACTRDHVRSIEARLDEDWW